MTSVVPSNPVIASEARQSIPVLIPVVLCGGSGTRLWPLSRKSFPKQFVPLIGNKSLLQLTLERVSLLSKNVICVASDEHRFLVAEAMQASKVQGTVLLEPVARNTAAAMAIAALVAKPEDLLLFCPSDHHIPDAAAFAQVVQQGIDAAQTGAIVTFGISPTFPSTAYGYIRQGGTRPDGAFNVEGFSEKPPQDKAEALLLSGSVLWNAGIFLCSAQTLLNALEQHAPDILQACEQAMGTAAIDGSFVRPQPQAFEACRSESIDYAVMEHHDNVAVLPFASAWSDVGSWNAVADLIIRPPLVYGLGVKANFAVLMRAVQRGWPLPLGAVHNQRSLVALSNLVDFIVTCITHPQAANQTFLVSDGQDLSTTELVRGMAQAAGVPARLLPVPVWALQAGATLLGKGDAVQRLCGNLQVDISKARSLLGWVPPVSVEEGLRRAMAV